MIDVTNVNKVELVKKAYELSRPQGLGMLHYDQDPLTDEEAKALVRPDGTFKLDYVRGRSCKFRSVERDGKILINNPWYDHTDEQFVQLLKHVGIDYEPEQEEHGTCCNCDPCRVKRGDAPLNPLTGM